MADDKKMFEDVNHESDYVFGINTTNKCYVLVPSKKIFEALMTNFEECNTRIWGLEVKVSDNENTLNTMVGGVESLEKKMTTSEEFENVLNTNITALQDEVSALNKLVNHYESRIAALENKVQELEDMMAATT